LVLIIIILFAAVIAGFYFKSHANPGTEPASFRSQPPQYLNVYETNPQIPLTVTVELEQYTYLSPIKLQAQGLTYFNETVAVTAKSASAIPPGTIMITSSAVPNAGPGSPPEKTIPVKNQSATQRFVVPVSLFRDTSLTWSGVAFFVPIPVIFQDNGSVFGHLPSVGAFEFPEGRPPSLLAEYERRTGQLRQVIINPVNTSPIAIPGDRGALFYGPNNISYTETLHNIVPVLRNEQIDYTIPSMTASGNIDYVWHSTGCCGLEPAFKVTDPAAVDSQNQAAFTSGIAFGVAGGAAIAVVQTLPKELPSLAWWSRRKRKSKQPLEDADA